jgi:hypothetical protein
MQFFLTSPNAKISKSGAKGTTKYIPKSGLQNMA